MKKVLNEISDSLTPREGYELEKVEGDKSALKEIINQYLK